MRPAIPSPVAGREEVDVRRLRIGGHGGLPVVPGRAHHLRPDPAGRGSRSRRDLLPEVAHGPGLGERLEASLRDLGLFLRFGGTATALFDLALELSLRLGTLAGVDVRHRLGRLVSVVGAIRAEDHRQGDGQADAKPCDHVTARNHRNPPKSALPEPAGSYDSAEMPSNR